MMASLHWSNEEKNLYLLGMETSDKQTLPTHIYEFYSGTKNSLLPCLSTYRRKDKRAKMAKKPKKIK